MIDLIFNFVVLFVAVENLFIREYKFHLTINERLYHTMLFIIHIGIIAYSMINILKHFKII